MVRAFLDASVLFSGIRSATGATRELFKWHLRGELQLVVSAYAIDECYAYPHCQDHKSAKVSSYYRMSYQT